MIPEKNENVLGNRGLLGSPSSINVAQINISPMPLQSSSKKKGVLHNGITSNNQINLGNQNGAHPLATGSSYKRIVNIYSMNNYKNNKRKSLAPESRIHLNHSMLPPGVIGTYDESKRGGS
jgi:hypothetical protein